MSPADIIKPFKNQRKHRLTKIRRYFLGKYFFQATPKKINRLDFSRLNSFDMINTIENLYFYYQYDLFHSMES